MMQRLQQVFREVFGDSSLNISSSTTANDISMWDSLTHLELIAAVEEAFQLKFSFSEIMNFNTVGDMLLLIEKKTGRGH